MRIEYLETVVEQACRSRAALNGTELAALPEKQHPAAEVSSDKFGRDDKSSVLDKIKASPTAPKMPHKPKNERSKKAQGPEL